MKQNILVIGGGIIGLSTAFAAAKAGFTVTLLEADPDYPPCSWVAGGILSALLPWQYRPAVHALIERSQAAYQDWVQELVALGGLNPEYRADGLLILPAFDSQQVSKWQRANRSVVNNVAPTEIAAGVAALGEALWLPHVAHIRSNRLLTAARQAAVNLGVRIESKVVLSLKKNAQRVLGAVTPTGDVLSDVTIIAAGAWSPIFDNLSTQIGDTWGDYVAALTDSATYLAYLGQPVTDVSQLWAFHIQQAMGLSPVSSLASAVDASVAGEGFPLEFHRYFAATLDERYE